MKDGLYNRAVSALPAAALALFCGQQLELQFSRHAQHACISDRNGWIRPPRAIALRPEDLVEAEVVNGQVVKVVARVGHDARHDLVLVLNPPAGHAAFVRTVWLNSKSDNHKSLRLNSIIS